MNFIHIIFSRNSDEPNPPSSSIWNQEIVQAIFSPQEAKAPKKGKKKSKDTKKIVK